MQLRWQHSEKRARVGPILMTVGTFVALIGSFQVWLGDGGAGRSSYELLGLIHRLGFVPNGSTRLLVRSWPLMPLMLTCGVVAVWWGWRRAGAVCCAFGAAYAAVVGGVVALASPDSDLVEISSAPAATAIGALIALLGSLAVVVVRVPSASCPTATKP